jgi:hypothetical protein
MARRSSDLLTYGVLGAGGVLLATRLYSGQWNPLKAFEKPAAPATGGGGMWFGVPRPPPQLAPAVVRPRPLTEAELVAMAARIK